MRAVGELSFLEKANKHFPVVSQARNVVRRRRQQVLTNAFSQMLCSFLLRKVMAEHAGIQKEESDGTRKMEPSYYVSICPGQVVSDNHATRQK